MSGTHEPAGTYLRSGTWILLCSCGSRFRGADKKHTLDRLHRHIGDSNRNCHTPEKKRYSSRPEAEQAALKRWRIMRGGNLLRAYECRCGLWHLTSRLDQPLSSRSQS